MRLHYRACIIVNNEQVEHGKEEAVVSALVEGAGIHSTVRMTGVSKPTILELIRDLGGACAGYHDEHVRGLKPERIQDGEIWSFIAATAGAGYAGGRRSPVVCEVGMS